MKQRAEAYSYLDCEPKYYNSIKYIHINNCSVGWALEYTDCFSAEGKYPLPNESPGYDTKLSHGEVPVMLRLWGMQSTPSLPLLPGPLWPRIVAADSSI